MIKRILKASYADVLVRDIGSSLDGSGEIYQEDHLTLDIVLDLYDLLDLLLNDGDEASKKDKFLELQSFTYWDFELNDFSDYEEEQDDASFYVWQLTNEMKNIS